MKLFLTIFCLFSLIACGKSGGNDSGQDTISSTSNDLNSKKINEDDSSLINVTSLSSEESFSTESISNIKVYVGTLQTEAQIPHYNEETNEGILKIYLGFDLPQRDEYWSILTNYCNAGSYLYTTTDQRNISSSWDNENAKIYFRYNGDSYLVGQYRSPETGREELTWSKPLLCEGEYSENCQLHMELSEVDKSSDSSIYIAPRARFFITINGVVENELLATTPYKQFNIYDHFTCQL